MCPVHELRKLSVRTTQRNLLTFECGSYRCPIQVGVFFDELVQYAKLLRGPELASDFGGSAVGVTSFAPHLEEVRALVVVRLCDFERASWLALAA